MSSMEGNLRWIALTAVAPITWGATYYVTREFLPDDLPLWGAAIRALPAGLLLLLVCRRLPRGQWWWKAAVLGLLNMSAFFALVYVAAQLLPSSVASVIMATAPLAMMGIAWLALAERPGAHRLAGAALGIGGVSTMVLSGSQTIDIRGVLASVGAMLMASLGYVLAKRWNDDVPVLASTSWQLLAGGLILLPAAWVVEGPPPSVTQTEVLAFGFVSIVATGLAFGAWFTGLRRLPAGTVGLIGLLNPVTGVLLGTVLAAERLTSTQITGIALVLTGIVLGTRGHRTRGHRTRGARGCPSDPAPGPVEHPRHSGQRVARPR